MLMKKDIKNNTEKIIKNDDITFEAETDSDMVRGSDGEATSSFGEGGHASQIKS